MPGPSHVRTRRPHAGWPIGYVVAVGSRATGADGDGSQQLTCDGSVVGLMLPRACVKTEISHRHRTRAVSHSLPQFGISQHRRTASAIPVASSPSTRNPVSPLAVTSGFPPTRRATVGTPAAMYLRMEFDSPSESDVSTPMSKPGFPPRRPARTSERDHVRKAKGRAELNERRAQVPIADDYEPRVGPDTRDQARGAEEEVNALYLSIEVRHDPDGLLPGRAVTVNKIRNADAVVDDGDLLERNTIEFVEPLRHSTAIGDESVIPGVHEAELPDLPRCSPEPHVAERPDPHDVGPDGRQPRRIVASWKNAWTRSMSRSRMNCRNWRTHRAVPRELERGEWEL